jgi:hypothetical protein
MSGKTPMWGNPTRERERERERERDLIIMLQESTLQQHTDNIQPRKIPHSNKFVPQNLCLENRAQICTVVRPPQNLCLEMHVQQSVVQPVIAQFVVRIIDG